MDDREVRSILSVHRTGESDARLREAERRAGADPVLADWWTEEQETDRAIASKLQEMDVPSMLKARLLSQENPPLMRQTAWRRRILLAAAAIVALAVMFGSWRGPFQPAISFADYRDEMVSFVKVDPALELRSNELSHVRDYLAKSGAPSQFQIPKQLREMQPIGCRSLRFRGHDVSLVCFRRGEGKLLHLFVVNRAAVPNLRASAEPQFSPEGEWMTAAWIEGDQAYLVTTEGDRAKLEKYIPSA